MVDARTFAAGLYLNRNVGAQPDEARIHQTAGVVLGIILATRPELTSAHD